MGVVWNSLGVYMANGEPSAGHGSSDWNPLAGELAGLTPDEIAVGYGLDAEEYGSYFETFDAWKTGFAKTEYDQTVAQIGAKSALDTSVFEANVVGIDRDVTEAGDTLTRNLGASINQISDQYADTMSQMIDAQATGMVGGATGRSMRTMAARSEEGYSATAGEMGAGYGSVTADLGQQKDLLQLGEDYQLDQVDRDKAAAQLDLDYQTEAEKQGYKDEIDATLDRIASSGGFDYEDYDSSDYLNDITGYDNHWKASDFEPYKNNHEFLKWFYDNIDSHDRDWYRGSADEVETAYEHFQANEAAGEGDDITYCCTAAMSTGYMNTLQSARIKRWHYSQPSIWRLGYDVWGKVIAENLVGKFDFAGECTEEFFQWHCNGKKSIKGAIAIIFIKPMSYLIA